MAVHQQFVIAENKRLGAAVDQATELPVEFVLKMPLDDYLVECVREHAVRSKAELKADAEAKGYAPRGEAGRKVHFTKVKIEERSGSCRVATNTCCRRRCRSVSISVNGGCNETRFALRVVRGRTRRELEPRAGGARPNQDRRLNWPRRRNRNRRCSPQRPIELALSLPHFKPGPPSHRESSNYAYYLI